MQQTTYRYTQTIQNRQTKTHGMKVFSYIISISLLIGGLMGIGWYYYNAENSTLNKVQNSSIEDSQSIYTEQGSQGL